MGVLSRLKRRVGGTARLMKDAVGAIADSARPSAAEPASAPSPGPAPKAPPSPAAAAPVDRSGRDGERFWFLDGGQADEGWEETNPSEAARAPAGAGGADGG
jgi:hypothetical protein